MKVYGHPMSTCTRKVLMTLAEKGARAELVMVDILKGEGHTPAHLARQPWGQVPVFEDDDGWQLFESRAICRYLDAKLPGQSLTPGDPRDRAKMEQWISVETSNFTPGAMKVIWQLLFSKMRGEQPNLDIVEEGKKSLRKAFDIIDRNLEGHGFLVGDSLTLADISFMPYLEYIAAAGESGLIEERERVGAWWNRLRARPTWQQIVGNQGSAA